MDATTSADEEKVTEPACEAQDSGEEKTKPQTVTAEEAAAEANGGLKNSFYEDGHEEKKPLEDKLVKDCNPDVCLQVKSKMSRYQTASQWT